MPEHIAKHYGVKSVDMVEFACETNFDYHAIITLDQEIEDRFVTIHFNNSDYIVFRNNTYEVYNTNDFHHKFELI